MAAGPNLYTSSSESALDNKQTIIKFATLADLNIAISRGQAADWESGQEIVVSAEPYGFSRIWNGSNALTIVLPNSNTITLSSSTNTILSTTGSPSGGNAGDYAWDKQTSTLYRSKTTTWPSGVGAFYSRKDLIKDRLRKSIAKARAYRTDITVPMVQPLAWAGNQAVYIYDRRVNNGHIYEVVTNGTTANSGGPDSQGPSSFITDGTAKWQYVGPVLPLSDNTYAPTMTIDGDKSDLTQGFLGATGVGGTINTQYFTFTGGVPYISQFGYPGCWENSAKTGNGNLGQLTDALGQTMGRSGNWFGYQFLTDAPKFALGYLTTLSVSKPFKIWVDGILVSERLYVADQAYSPGSHGFLIDLKRPWMKKIRIESLATLTLTKIWIAPNYQLAAAPLDEDAVRILYWGDSIVNQNTGGFAGISQVLADLLGQRESLMTSAVSGTGPVSGSASAFNYVERLFDITLRPHDVFIFSFPGNDGWTNTTSDAEYKIKCRDAMYQVFNHVYAQNPDVIIICPGAFGQYSTATADKESLVFGYIDDYNTANNTDILKIPTFTDPTGSWVTGTTGNATTPTGAGNMDWISVDGAHPTIWGGKYFATRLFHKICSWLGV